ncbi:MAG: hypothetical protein ACR2OO_15325 [Thermomicrobiales bacterium]
MSREISTSRAKVALLPVAGDDDSVFPVGSPFAGLLFSSGVGLATFVCAFWWIQRFL